MFQATVYKIMIGCPSDIQDEIQIAKEVLYHWNNLHSEHDKIVLLPSHWSISSYPTMGKHPQKSINEQVVEKSDLLICIFGSKLGTPTDTEISGTVEEIKEHRKAGKDVMIFFKKSVDDITSIDPEQLKKIKDFKDNIKQEAILGEFSKTDDFRNELSDKLQLYINSNWIKSVLPSTENRLSAKSNFSKEEYEILKEWVLSKNGDLRVLGTQGDEYYMFGEELHKPQNGKERAEYNDFIERLKYAFFIERTGSNTYALKKAAYDYVDNQEKDKSKDLSLR